MGKIAENKQQKKERLLETAFSLFSVRGMAKTSVSDITTAAGVAKGTFYLYFRDKYDLGNKLISHKSASLFRHAADTLSRSDAVSFEDRFIVLVDDLLNQLQANPFLLRFINKNLSWGIFQQAIHRSEESEETSFMSFYHQMIQDNPSASFREPELMLFTLIELIGSSCHSVILDRNPVPLEAYKPHLYACIRSIIRTFEVPAEA